MRTTRLKPRALACGLITFLWPAILAGQTRAIDTKHSVLTVHVFKSGLFSAFAHNHEIAAPIAGGAVEVSPIPRVSLRVDARKMRVLDPETSFQQREFGMTPVSIAGGTIKVKEEVKIEFDIVLAK